MKATETYRGWHDDAKEKPPARKIREGASYLHDQYGEQ